MDALDIIQIVLEIGKEIVQAFNVHGSSVFQMELKDILSAQAQQKVARFTLLTRVDELFPID